MKSQLRSKGFTLLEMAFGILITGLILVAFANIFTLFQRSATTTRDYAETQQNARVAVDYLTEYLRQAGAGTNYTAGQRHIVHAGPYQIAINADLDNDETIAGDTPLMSISIDHAPATVPATGTAIYTPDRNFDSPAETIVLTLDSEADGTVDSGDQGDDEEEDGNPRLYVLKRTVHGYDGGQQNEVRSANLALIRGPDAYKDGHRPEPLFQYYYDHDEDNSTADRLWGDTDLNGTLSDSEIGAVNNMPDNLLSVIRKIHVTVISEADRYDHKVSDTTDGYRSVSMHSEVYIRNTSRLRATIYGYVYHDANGDGTRDADETGLPNVDIQIGDHTLTTNGFGVYSAPVGAGNYKVDETDPSGYSSTTPNSVSVAIGPGEVRRVDFGDKASMKTGVIMGTVYHDFNGNGKLDGSEPGIPGVTVTIDNGTVLRTDGNGEYSLMVPLGSYKITETDPEGWGSTTANTMSASITAPGKKSINDFGDVESPMYGRVEGFVYEDENKNGARDPGDAGLPNVTLTLSTGDSIHTDATGYYYFDVIGGTYGINERDRSGYSSSTPNTIVDLVVVPDTLITINFGDFLNSGSGFDEVAVGSTGHALTIALGDFNEDAYKRMDKDIIVGTPASGSGNLLVFHNQWQDATTPITQLFESKPSFRRDARGDVSAIAVRDFDYDGGTEVLTGLSTASSKNLQVWANEGSGQLGTTPEFQLMSQASTSVLATHLADLNSDGTPDLVVGLKSAAGTFLGAFEIYTNYGEFTMSQHENTASWGVTLLGEIHAIDTGDVDGDGDLDLVTGSHDSDYTGYIDVWENVGYASGYFQWVARYPSPGAVNAVRIVDLMEDNNGDADLIAAVSIQPLQGAICVWHSDNGVFGKAAGGAVPAGGSGETFMAPTAEYDAHGEPLTLSVASINEDIFPDVVFGTRSTAFYGGDLHYVATRGQLPAQTVRLNSDLTGEFAAVALGDLNNDYKIDIVAGTKISPSQGKILLYINNGGGK